MKILIATVLFTCICAMTPLAQAGTVIVSEVNGYVPGEEDGTATLYVDKYRCRMEFKGADSHNFLIYTREDDNPILYLVDQHKWSYIELKQKDIKKIKGKIADQMEMMEGYLAKMDAAQREQTRKQYAKEWERMESIVSPPQPGDYKYEAVEGEDAKVNDWNTSQYRCFVKGELEDELWIAPWEETGLTFDELAVITDMYEDFGEMAGSAAFFMMMWKQGKIEGFPVRIMGYQDGLKAQQTTVLEVRKQELDDDLFVVGKDYDKQPFMPE